MSEPKHQGDYHPKKNFNHSDPIDLRLAIEFDRVLQQLFEKIGIDVLRVVEGKVGPNLHVIGYPADGKVPNFLMPILVKESIDETLQTIRDSLKLITKRPIDIASLNREAVDLTDLDLNDSGRAGYFVRKLHEGQYVLEYMCYKIKNLTVGAFASNKERSYALNQWIKRRERIREWLCEETILAYWWNDDEGELHVITEPSNEEKHGDYDLAEMVLESEIEELLKELNAQDTVTITFLDDDPMVGEELTYGSTEEPDDDQRDTAYIQATPMLTTDQNGLLIGSPFEIDQFKQRLREELSDHEALAILPERKQRNLEDEEWRCWWPPSSEHRWEVRLFVRQHYYDDEE